MFDIITIGSAVYDVFVSSKKIQLVKGKQFSSGVGECLSLGSKIPVDTLVFDTGGGATNTAVTFQRCGLKTAAVCKIGDDVHGQEVLRALKKENIDPRFVVTTNKYPTGYSVILTAGMGDRAILTFRGASSALRASDVPFSKLPTRWLYVSSLGGNRELLKKILLYARKHEIALALNPGSAELAWGKKFFQPFLPTIQVLIMNTEEATIFYGLSYDQKREALKRAETLSPNIVVVTDGPKGAYAFAKKRAYFIPTTRKTVVNATGAGDAFGSGFVAGLMLQNDIRYALRLGLLNAESVVQKIGAKQGIISHAPKVIRRPRIIPKIVFP